MQPITAAQSARVQAHLKIRNPWSAQESAELDTFREWLDARTPQQLLDLQQHINGLLRQVL